MTKFAFTVWSLREPECPPPVVSRQLDLRELENIKKLVWILHISSNDKKRHIEGWGHGWWTYCWGQYGRCLGWLGQWWLQGLALSAVHVCAAFLTRWPYTAQTCVPPVTQSHPATYESLVLQLHGGRLSETDIYLCWSKGYVMNLGSNGMSGRLLQYLTRQTTPDLKD